MNFRIVVIVFLLALLIVGAIGYVWYTTRLDATRSANQIPPPPEMLRPVGQVIEIKAPLGLPPVPAPFSNPLTKETVALGRKLYYDTRLSVDNTVSCATCHDPKFGFSDGKSVSNGFQNKTGTRNSPTVLNSAYSTLQFWDGRAATLEKQAEGPIENPVEMAHTLAGAIARLQADPEMVQEFQAAFGPGPITDEKLTMAIAAFERTVISANSPFDRFYFGGDNRALSPAAQRGLRIFIEPAKGNCNVCHTIDDKFALFTDNKFHNIGIGADTKGNLEDLGRFNQTKVETDKGAFKTPTLRNIAQTAPYMHDGSLKTLKDVIDYYVTGGNSNPYLDKEMKSLSHLSFEERKDLLAFLEALTGEMPKDVGPPPSMASVPAKGPTKKGL